MAVITLLTDFGMADEYVGVMKGVIASIAPQVAVIDITHQIDPQDITQAAFLLPAYYPYFPAQTVHVVVVDPGVGTSRDLLLLTSAGHHFLAPDNGVLTLLLDQAQRFELIRVTDRSHGLPRTSDTFHGRDLFAPVAAHLAKGLEPTQLGHAMDPERAVRLDGLAPRPEPGGGLRGVVVAIDRFGNLITNIHRRHLATIGWDMAPGRFSIKVENHSVPQTGRTYADTEPGGLLALIGSRDYLEIAVNCGHAAHHLAVHKGAGVTVHPQTGSVWHTRDRRSRK